MDKRYISEAEFKSYIEKLISLLKQGSPKEEVLRLHGQLNQLLSKNNQFAGSAT